MEENENKKGKEDKNENKEKTILSNNDNKKKYIILILIIVIVILIAGVCYLYMNSINKQKSIVDKDKTIKKQQEELLNAEKDKDKENEKKKEKEKQTTKPNEQQKETKYLSKEEYLKIFKEYVGTDFPGEYSKENEYNKKIEIIEDAKEGAFGKCKYYLRKSGFVQQPSSGIAEGEYNILTKEEVKKLLYDFAKKMGYSDVTEYKEDYEMSEKGFRNGIPFDLSVELEAKNSKNGILKLAILFLRDKDNKVTNKVYSAYVGIY